MTRRITAAQYREIAKKKPKYRNVRVKMDGHMFDSKAEASEYIGLKTMLQMGTIKDLQIHPRFDLGVCMYVADFAYRSRSGSRRIIDVKGVLTAACRIKLKLMEQAGMPVTLLTRNTNPELWRRR